MKTAPPMLSGRTFAGRTFGWYVRRLSVMQPAEIWARMGALCGMSLLAVRHRLGLTVAVHDRVDPARHRFFTSKDRLLPSVIVLEGPLAGEAAARVLNGGLPLDGWGWCWRQNPEVWHRAPETGRLWPRAFFGSIPYREGNPYGDVRRIWEPSRLQQLAMLGSLAADDPALRDQAVTLLEAQFLSWIEANPSYEGVHYISAMECGLRLIAVCHAFDAARHWIKRPELVWSAVLQLVEGHAGLIRQRISLHSSLGNHTIAEAAALVYAGVLFPDMADAEEWRSLGLWLLESEASHQILVDGGGAEQGLRYARFVSDLYELTCAVLTTHGHSIPKRIQDALADSRRFLAHMADSEGRLPAIGDSDDGFALSPWLRFPRHSEKTKTLVTFASSGYSLVRGRGPSGATLILDHGPLGLKPCYAHGHADALSVLLRDDDEEFLVDPGTFAYSGSPEWRAYFRSTRAHNTITVDRLDQAVQETAFQWSSPYHARLVTGRELPDGRVVVIAVHDGYEQRIGVRHWRGILYSPPDLWIIVDMLAGRGSHALELNWHLGSRPVPAQDGYRVQAKRSRLHLAVEGGRVEVLRGCDDPVIGWRAPFYGRKEPLNTVQATYEGPLPHEFVTYMITGEGEGHHRQPAVKALKELMYEAGAH